MQSVALAPLSPIADRPMHIERHMIEHMDLYIIMFICILVLLHYYRFCVHLPIRMWLSLLLLLQTHAPQPTDTFEIIY